MQMHGLNSTFPFHFKHHKSPVCGAATANPPSPPAAAGRRSLYEVLRIRRNASQVEIKTAYRTLAKLHHPDATASMAAAASLLSDGRDFIEIHKAYAALSDPDARAVYDSKLDVDSQRRRDTARYRSPCYPTRRWESDQCW